MEKTLSHACALVRVTQHTQRFYELNMIFSWFLLHQREDRWRQDKVKIAGKTTGPAFLVHILS